jgi:hypothetical protein
MAFPDERLIERVNLRTSSNPAERLLPTPSSRGDAVPH